MVSKYAGSSVRIDYQYAYESVCASPKRPADLLKEVYTCGFQFDVFQGSRTIWIHKDICRHHGDETRVAAMQNVTPVRVGDRIEIAVNLYNAFGKTAVSSVQWLPPRFAVAPSMRKCPVEEELHDWYDLDGFMLHSTERLQIPNFFTPQLEHLSTQYAGLDIAVSKSWLRASSLGVVPQADRILGSRFEVLPKTAPIILPLKRIGLQHDRFTKIQLRQDDKVLLYISQGGKHDNR
ncbi:unnamed protein product [Amoebophrya sp. A25]|nr:unnamed protein product [Amoebophrya sp. A25]|eukprot:GSA25T00027575001.1